jgi:hypothetical protein
MAGWRRQMSGLSGSAWELNEDNLLKWGRWVWQLNSLGTEQGSILRNRGKSAIF